MKSPFELDEIDAELLSRYIIEDVNNEQIFLDRSLT